MFVLEEVLISVANSMTDVPVTLRPPSVSERVKVNPDCSRAMNALTFIIKTEYTANKNRQTLSQPKPWCNDSGELNLHHGYYTTITTSKRFFRKTT